MTQSDPLTVLLTGATGLVGGALAGALLDAGHKVIAVVRGEGRQVLDIESRNRADEIITVQGDVSAPGFAMEQIPGEIDLLIHCAATTDFTASDAVYEAVNIGGARHAVALAQQLGARLLHVSTAYSCGRADGLVPEAPADPEREFTNGYERSKAIAESHVMAARQEELIAAIARPSIIVGRLSDGAIPRQDDFYHLFRLFGSPLLKQVPAIDGAAFAIVPLDHVVSGLMAMAENMAQFDGDAVHLVADKPFPLADMLEIVAEYPRAYPAEIVHPDAYDVDQLDRRSLMVHRKVGAQFFDYFARVPLFESRILAEKAGIAAPHIDKAALRRMVEYCHGTGFLDWK
ncbi:SDR family oxidoreductase [Alterisphingorhabdus coralli]|uniref:SDR family oxidoreductase n=1 Tax=Alterisphingorhabdus coralli TaxID=3071408 RepID=A0AA97HZG3_9SPHN|nr:SDR family oxidoreductase [Parasphingorhabdus sp. SCSIO 66989]WOE74629.1 SDR family oxidoreductase [Parasphingorhabdus sp. SCSIO 66989]